MKKTIKEIMAENNCSMMDAAKLIIKLSMANEMLTDIDNNNLKYPDSAPILREAAMRLKEGKAMTGLQRTHREMNYWDAGPTKNQKEQK